MSVMIRSTGVAIPQRRMENAELAAMVDTTDEWIRSHTGIRCRHIAADGELTSDLAAAAATMALERAGISAREIDLLVLATATPDYLGFPSTACLVQRKIGADGCAALDVVAGCTGFIYALEVAAAMLEARGGRNALVIGAETLTRITDWKDRATCVLFGDGAGAAVLSRIEEGGRGVLKTILGAEGSGAGDLYLVQAPRERSFERSEPIVPRIAMNGQNVYNFAVKTISVLVGRLLHASVYKLEDFAWIVPHQANARIVQAAAKRLGAPEERFYLNLEEYANTSSASIPIALHEMTEKGLLKKGDLVMLIGFGSGLTYGAAAIRW
ncbi:MAG TPA: beta-ketoacyl-ACP synthase III [Spirochaetia bacterium]|nr:beta-ketoacyl-ACP synthase III [Spirochaetia bacterium]HRZ65051.1 beta-ketoacyl-ACP synthase III [Spirochaetia bacterium]